MKLKNKKTGEIAEFNDFYRIVGKSEQQNVWRYLAELNEDWEDYEEPKGYWYITCDGRVLEADANEDGYEEHLSGHKQIGNYFETREEAEKAVEKLKAWKQLKDNCNFRFNGVERDKRGRLIGVKVEFDKVQVTFDTAKKCYEILDLLFGGEE